MTEDPYNFTVFLLYIFCLYVQMQKYLPLQYNCLQYSVQLHAVQVCNFKAIGCTIQLRCVVVYTIQVSSSTFCNVCGAQGVKRKLKNELSWEKQKQVEMNERSEKWGKLQAAHQHLSTLLQALSSQHPAPKHRICSIQLKQHSLIELPIQSLPLCIQQPAFLLLSCQLHPCNVSPLSLINLPV